MKKLTREQREFALSTLDRVITSRALSQVQVAELTGTSQGTICKILHRQQEPTDEQLERIYERLGMKLTDVLHEAELVPDRITGYMATPLTEIVRDPKKETNLREVVKLVRELASAGEFS